MTTTTILFAGVIASLVAAQGVKSFNDGQEPPALTAGEIQAIESGVAGVAGKMTAWEETKMTVVESLRDTTPLAEERAVEGRKELEEGKQRQTEALGVFRVITEAF